ncbi:MAG: hypothetical protein NTY19_23180 [Planctomycetota bacterium]|nr:hypothetical protein [Planctomycetota bacterium]
MTSPLLRMADTPLAEVAQFLHCAGHRQAIQSRTIGHAQRGDEVQLHFARCPLAVGVERGGEGPPLVFENRHTRLPGFFGRRSSRAPGAADGIGYRWPDDVRDDVLARLLKLNAERAAEERRTGEAAAAEDKRQGKTKKGKKGNPKQQGLGFNDE